MRTKRTGPRGTMRGVLSSNSTKTRTRTPEQCVVACRHAYRTVDGPAPIG